MNKNILKLLGILFLLFAVDNGLKAQSMGSELINMGGGSFKILWSHGSSITTNSNGSYNASNGSCTGCANTLPPVTVYGYRNNNAFTPSYYNQNGTNYGLPNYSPNQGQYTDYYSILIIGPGGNSTSSVMPSTNPCSPRTEANGAGVTNIAKIPGLVGAMNSVAVGVATNTSEKSFSFGVNIPGGAFNTTPVQTHGTSGGVIPPTYPGMSIFGDVHTHTSNGYYPPSAGDIYHLLMANNAYPDIKNSFVIAPDGTKYALTVIDHAKVTAFLANPNNAKNLNVTANGGWVSGSAIEADATSVRNSLNPNNSAGAVRNEAYEYSQAYVLAKNNMGISLLKTDANGNFRETQTVKSTNTTGPVVYYKFRCN